MENIPQQSTVLLTPMGKVWKVVVATVLGTALLSSAWHGMEMLRIRAMHAREANSVRASITNLTAYRDLLRTQNASQATTTQELFSPQ